MDPDSILCNWYHHYMGDISVFTLYLWMLNKYYSKTEINYELLALEGNLEAIQMYGLYHDSYQEWVNIRIGCLIILCSKISTKN